MKLLYFLTYWLLWFLAAFAGIIPLMSPEGWQVAVGWWMMCPLFGYAGVLFRDFGKEL